MIHLKNTGFAPKNAREIVYRARDLASDMNVSVRVARIAKKFVELDVAVEKGDLDQLVAKLTPIGPVDNIRHVIEEVIDKEQGIQDGIFYFNSERYNTGRVTRPLRVSGSSVLGERKRWYRGSS